MLDVTRDLVGSYRKRQNRVGKVLTLRQAHYTYDSFGNITQDKNKGITAIKYNHLNLPKEVVFNTGKITYIYDATGTRLSKKVEPSGGLAVTTDYLSGFQYLNGELQFFPHAEGYVENRFIGRGGRGSYIYIFTTTFIKII